MGSFALKLFGYIINWVAYFRNKFITIDRY